MSGTGEIVFAVQWKGTNDDEMTKFVGPIPGDPLGFNGWDGHVCELWRQSSQQWEGVSEGDWVVKAPHGFEIYSDAAFKRRYNPK